MKVLSIQQPWASLIVAGIKDIENRTWKPKELLVAFSFTRAKSVLCEP